MKMKLGMMAELAAPEPQMHDVEERSSISTARPRGHFCLHFEANKSCDERSRHQKPICNKRQHPNLILTVDAFNIELLRMNILKIFFSGFFTPISFSI